MTHTKGPWVAEPADMFGDHNIVLADGDDMRAIAAVVSNLRPEDEVAANALLVAAAPELLDAGIRLTASLDPEGLNPEQYNAWCDLESAIAKATGEA